MASRVSGGVSLSSRPSPSPHAIFQTLQMPKEKKKSIVKSTFSSQRNDVAFIQIHLIRKIGFGFCVRYYLLSLRVSMAFLGIIHVPPYTSVILLSAI